MKFSLYSLIAAAALATAAQATVVAGTSGSLNGGSVTAFADVTGSHLNAVGYKVSGAVVRDPGASGGELFLTLPSQASATGFTVLGLEWNPHGHEPAGVYDQPHFDLHFYYIPDSKRMTIPGGVIGGVDPKLLPAGYSQPGPTVPMMGGHSVDLTSSEWNGGSFTQTFIYGFFEGKEIFLEPMVTQAYFQSLIGSESFTIRQPGMYGQDVVPDLVPTKVTYAYDRDSDLYTISLGDFIGTSVPEPSSLALVAFGIPAVGFALRRARRKKTA
ncbi:PEP-CTERM sorting domain-containing protein [Rhizomicrobium electricum]|uniref:Ice-binding protein C-terminal domain-containing protein n=1 Tax=Rhizomicrobium electricum TaxID=480070 RepID=A0ABP3PKH7_9PROT|nr:PEP-CTERM sorting domain-containing protein [Rhizomicrobium electricum]NIJ48621.1 hypothetical protein [Rhizomicrobium electricum]